MVENGPVINHFLGKPGEGLFRPVPGFAGVSENVQRHAGDDGRRATPFGQFQMDGQTVWQG